MQLPRRKSVSYETIDVSVSKKSAKTVQCEHCLSKYNPKNRKRADRHEGRDCKPGKKLKSNV